MRYFKLMIALPIMLAVCVLQIVLLLVGHPIWENDKKRAFEKARR